MAVYSTPSGAFDYTFDSTFPRVPFIAVASGGSFDYTFDILFQIRATVKGSIEGSTFQKAGRSYTIRHHNIPTLKESIKKLTRMQIFKGNIASYQGTSGPQRATWEAEKPNYPRVRSDGTLRIPNRYHLYISSNQRADFSNVPQIDSIGSVYPDQAFILTAATLNYGTSTGVLSFNQSTVPAGSNLQIYMSRVLAPGSLSLASARPRLTLIIEEGDPVAVNFFADFIAQWPQNPKPVGFLFAIATFMVPLDTGQPQSAGTPFGSVI